VAPSLSQALYDDCRSATVSSRPDRDDLVVGRGLAALGRPLQPLSDGVGALALEERAPLLDRPCGRRGCGSTRPGRGRQNERTRTRLRARCCSVQAPALAHPPRREGSSTTWVEPYRSTSTVPRSSLARKVSRRV